MGNSLHKVALAAAICLFFAQGAGAQDTSQQSVKVTGVKKASPWFRAESQHFVVYSDTGNQDVTHLLNNLEKLDHLLRIYTRDYRVARGVPQKLTLYFHDRAEGFNALATDEPEEAVGLYSSCGAGVQGFAVNLKPLASLRNDQLIKAPLNSSLSYIFEAYARHFLYRYTDIRAPVAYIDGLAQYFSGVRFSDNHMVVGRPPVDVARYLYHLDSGNKYNLSYENVLDPSTSRRKGFKAESGSRLEFLARSWIMTHYMLSSSENRIKMGEFLDLVHHDVPAGKAFETSFGLKVDDIGQAMWRYRIKGLEIMEVDVPSLPTAKVEFTTLPASTTDFILADAVLKSCPSRKAGEGMLQALSQKAAAIRVNDFAKLILSRAQIDWGNAADALPYLTEATRKDGANAEALYLLGLANLRLHERDKAAAKDSYLQAAKSHLARARALNPGSAQAAFAFYEAEMRGSERPGETALEAAITAWKNAHEVNTYARSAALAYAYTGRATEADNALTLIAHNVRDPEMAKWAASWQGRLAKGVDRADLLAEMRREISPPAFREWTLAGENLMKDVVQRAGMENARNYLDNLRLANPGGDSIIDAPRKP